VELHVRSPHTWRGSKETNFNVLHKTQCFITITTNQKWLRILIFNAYEIISWATELSVHTDGPLHNFSTHFAVSPLLFNAFTLSSVP
jgi:hypothetical protein